MIGEVGHVIKKKFTSYDILMKHLQGQLKKKKKTYMNEWIIHKKMHLVNGLMQGNNTFFFICLLFAL